MGWSGISYGELLSHAKVEGFEALVTKDANLQYEQTLTNLPLAVVILQATSNDISDIRPLLPLLQEALNDLPPKQITVVSQNCLY